MMELLLLVSMGVPLALALLLAVRPIESESTVAELAQAGAVVSAMASLAAVLLWLPHAAHGATTPPHVLLEHGGYQLVFELALDGASAVFLILAQFITGMVIRFSRFYLHREPGFQRFFATVLMFQAAMCLLSLAGNLDLMFAGWEMLGLASFLLIAFYWNRQSALRNALKTYSVYRIADIGMLLAASLEASGGHHQLGLLLLLAAVGKSGQFPFSFWVPRAMEGPTPSSALFYGGLSVHAGAYLLLRTFDLWSGSLAVRICVGAVGLLTAALCSMFSRVQSTIKAQVGYASVTQVGLMFLEIALGLRVLALVHLVCNALLRSYQLLVSPSAVAYLLRRHAGAGAPQASEARSLYVRFLPHRLRSTLYVFAMSEGYLKDAIKSAIWAPLRQLGAALVPHGVAILTAGACAAVGAMVIAPSASQQSADFLVGCLLGVALLFSGCGLAAWRRPIRASAWVLASTLAVALAVLSLSPSHARFAAVAYAAAVALSGGLCVAGAALAAPGPAPLERFAGRSTGHRLAAGLFLVGALGVAGFPLLPTFVGEDLLLHATLPESGAISVLLACLFALNGYLAIRNFSFTFLGRALPTAGGEPSPGTGYASVDARAEVSALALR